MTAQALACDRLRLCLCGRRDASAAAALRAAARQPDWSWEAIAALAFAEGLAPLLYNDLAQTELWPAIPPGVRVDLQAAYEGSAIRNALLACELEKVLGRLDEAGVACLLLKGAALAQEVYGDPALRPMNDLDLLVHRADLGRALGVLAACGYTESRVEERPGVTLAFESELSLGKPGVIGIQIELHWRLLDAPFYQRRLPMAWFWETATPVQVGRTVAAGLGPEALLLYLCAHLVLHHRGQGLRWWVDLAEVLHKQGRRLDWPELLRRAAACDLVMSLQAVLPALADAWAAPVPADVLAQLAAMQPSPAERRVHADLTAGRRPVARRFWADLMDLPDWRARGRYAWAHFVPSPAYMLARYRPAHRWLLPLLYPWRWLIGLAGALAWKIAAIHPRSTDLTISSPSAILDLVLPGKSPPQDG